MTTYRQNLVKIVGFIQFFTHLIRAGRLWPKINFMTNLSGHLDVYKWTITPTQPHPSSPARENKECEKPAQILESHIDDIIFAIILIATLMDYKTTASASKCTKFVLVVKSY